jgi:hypothetical protein
VWPCPPRAERRSIDLVAAQIHSGDLPGVGEVIERVGVEDDEARALAGRERSHVVQAQHFGRRPGGGDQHLLRRHAGLGHPLELLERGVTGKTVLDPGVVSEGDGHPGPAQPGQAADLHLVRAWRIRACGVASPRTSSRSILPLARTRPRDGRG